MKNLILKNLSEKYGSDYQIIDGLIELLQKAYGMSEIKGLVHKSSVITTLEFALGVSDETPIV